jgi:uncharacterized protein (DUF362 family)
MVAIQKCSPESSYVEIEESVRRIFDFLGGIEPYVSPGEKVLLKPNLVCDILKYPFAFFKGSNSFGTDGRIIEALTMLCKEAGASKVAVGECEDFPNKYTQYGYRSLCKRIRVPLLDLNIGPYLKFHIPNGFLFKNMFFNFNLAKFDKIISCAKLKVHSGAGVSLCMKNLMGLLPVRYSSSKKVQKRKGPYFAPRDFFHEKHPQLGSVLPFGIVDLNIACPVDFAIIDGMVASNKHENVLGEPVEMNVIIGGNNVVSTDTVGAYVMGLNPEEDNFILPSTTVKNHLCLASEKKIGTNTLSKISLLGEKIINVKKQLEIKI